MERTKNRCGYLPGSLVALGLEEVERRLEASLLLPVGTQTVDGVVPERVPCCVCDPLEPWHRGVRVPPA